MCIARLLPALLCLAALSPMSAVADPIPVAELGERVRERARPSHATLEVDRTVHLGVSYLVESLTVTVGQRVVLQEEALETGWTGRVLDREPVRASLAAGDRTVVVEARLRGKGTGDFAWLSHYTLDVTGRCEVELLRGVTTSVDVALVRKAGPFADFGEGIEVECRSSVQSD
jgi:hypothetical protein